MLAFGTHLDLATLHYGGNEHANAAPRHPKGGCVVDSEPQFDLNISVVARSSTTWCYSEMNDVSVAAGFLHKLAALNT